MKLPFPRKQEKREKEKKKDLLAMWS